ncbi:MAG: glycosyltransferase family 4 protein [Candidatus Heimdallarchaeaceae archaeon]
MKILFVCEGINRSSIIAQPWKHVFEMAKRMKGRGNDVQILTDYVQGSSVEEEIDGVTICKVKKKRLLFDREQLLERLNVINADIINWHGSDVWSAIQFWRLRKWLKKDIVWTLHSGILSIEDLKNLDALDYFQLYKFWNNISSMVFPKYFVKQWIKVPFLRHVITLSKRTAEKLKNYGLTVESVTPIPSGVDVNLFKPSSNTAENFTLLYFGPLSSFRGVDVLLSAFKFLRRSLPSARLVLLARESNSNSYLFKKAKNSKKVETVVGILDQKELLRRLNDAAVVVLPFKFWPQVECPSTVLEAMAMEKTVITTNVGAIPEIIKNGENGIMVPPRKPKVLAKILLNLLIDIDLSARIGKNARRHIQNFYSWDVVVPKTLDVFRRAKFSHFFSS